MAISGLMVTLCADAREAERAVQMLSSDARLSLGERAGRRLAVVAETASAEQDQELWNDLHALPGIECVDVTFVSVEEGEPLTSEPQAQARGCFSTMAPIRENTRALALGARIPTPPEVSPVRTEGSSHVNA